MKMSKHKFNRREFLGSTAAMATAMMVTPQTIRAATPRGDGIRIQRLDWAGIRIEAGNSVAYIDAVTPEDPKVKAMSFASKMKNRLGLITHEHDDHYDQPYLESLIGANGTLICHRDTMASIERGNFRVKGLNLWEPAFLPRSGADMIAIPVPASDGFGLSQVSWVIKVGGKTIIHCGDTMWHGHLVDVGAVYGPFEYAFMPINGARQTIGRFVDQGLAMALTPEQAVAAAQSLKAKVLVPIHYGSPTPPSYLEIDRPLERLQAEAKRLSVGVKRLDVGDWLMLEELK
jgi:L-ascorbate metabolism protein UlaG (beta-lactamase superfamily)